MRTNAMTQQQRTWADKLVDFLLGPVPQSHPIYMAGAAAGFSETAREKRAPRPHHVDSPHVALAVGGFGAYGAAGSSLEYENGDR
jgi:hypothetical protein